MCVWVKCVCVRVLQELVARVATPVSPAWLPRKEASNGCRLAMTASHCMVASQGRFQRLGCERERDGEGEPRRPQCTDAHLSSPEVRMMRSGSGRPAVYRCSPKLSSVIPSSPKSATHTTHIRHTHNTHTTHTTYDKHTENASARTHAPTHYRERERERERDR